MDYRTYPKEKQSSIFEYVQNFRTCFPQGAQHSYHVRQEILIFSSKLFLKVGGKKKERQRDGTDNIRRLFVLLTF